MSIKFQRLELFSSDIRLQESRNTRHPPSLLQKVQVVFRSQSGARLQRPLLLPSPGLCNVTRQPALRPDNVQDPVLYHIRRNLKTLTHVVTYYRSVIYFISILGICDLLAIKIIYKWMSLLHVVIFSCSTFWHKVTKFTIHFESGKDFMRIKDILKVIIFFWSQNPDFTSF